MVEAPTAAAPAPAAPPAPAPTAPPAPPAPGDIGAPPAGPSPEVAAQNDQAMVTKGDNAWRIHRSNTKDTVEFVIKGYQSAALKGRVNVNDQQWHHVAATFNGSKKILYIDGRVDTSADVTPQGAPGFNDFPVLIGENAQKTFRHFHGQIDDVRIYNRALKRREVVAIVRAAWNASKRK